MTQLEKESCQTIARLFKVMDNKFRPQHNGTILSLQYCKLSRQYDEMAKEWIGTFRMKAAKYKYKENEKCLKEQSINDINDDSIDIHKGH